MRSFELLANPRISKSPDLDAESLRFSQFLQYLKPIPSINTTLHIARSYSIIRLHTPKNSE